MTQFNLSRPQLISMIGAGMLCIIFFAVLLLHTPALGLSGLSAVGATKLTQQPKGFTLPNGGSFTRNCDITALGATDVTPTNQVNYLFCLLVGINQNPSVVQNLATKLSQGATTLPTVSQIIFTGPQFYQTFVTPFPNDADFVTVMYRLIFWRDPTSDQLNQWVAYLANPQNSRQELVASFLQTSLFASKNPILFPPLTGSSFTLSSAQMLSASPLAWAKTLNVQAMLSADHTTEAQVFLDLVDSGGALANRYAVPTYFSTSTPVTVSLAEPLPSVAPGTYTLRVGVMDMAGTNPQYLNSAVNTVSVPPGYTQAATYDYHYAANFSGATQDEVADILIPNDSKSQHPAILFLHGGAWHLGDKSAKYPSLATTYTALGYVVVNADYRLVVPGTMATMWPAQAEDAQLLMRYLRANATSLKIDPAHICAYGDSAGGHLALLLGVQADIIPGDRAKAYPSVSPQANCVVDEFGPTNLTAADLLADLGGAIANLFGGATLPDYDALYNSASVVPYVNASTSPVFITHGTQDIDVPMTQSTELMYYLNQYGVPYVFDQYTGGHEFSGISNADMQKIRADIISFLATYDP